MVHCRQQSCPSHTQAPRAKASAMSNNVPPPLCCVRGLIGVTMSATPPADLSTHRSLNHQGGLERTASATCQAPAQHRPRPGLEVREVGIPAQRVRVEP
ncbi:unnamed protein product, partial [Ectocarpus sp. 8 AP-2014]